MVPAILGKKVGMTQIFDEAGRVIPVTVVKPGPCTVLQVRSKEIDGYEAVQLGFGDVKAHRSTLAMIAHAAKARTSPKRFVREIRLDEPTERAAGDVVTVEVFEAAGVEYVDVVGTSKGHGFQGVMARHGFGGQPASHGVERKHRSAGSIGGSAPLGLGRSVKKGKRMPGHDGHVRRTVRNQRLVCIDKERGLLMVRGAVPGPNGGYVLVRKSKTKGGGS